MADYNDFWFVETRVKTNNLKRWFLYAILLFAFVSVFTSLYVKTFYGTIKSYEINTTNPVVTVEEAKKTNANGYIKGNVKNISQEEINGKYILFTFYTKNNVDIGKEYVEIGTLKPDENKTYEAKFEYPNVERFVVTISDSKE